MEGVTLIFAEYGDRRCRTCGKVHDCYQVGQRGCSWAALDDGHAYFPEDWRTVAIRYGFDVLRERDD